MTTVCTACRSENPAASKFCHECGSALALICAACGAQVATSQRFCGECGTAQVAADSPPAGSPAAARPIPPAQRRMCSVLFVDLVGFTPLTEARDAEDVRELLARYFDQARTVIERYGGVVEKFIGDAVMAIWGTPVVVEGDAERAVRAALDVVSAVAVLGEQIGAPGLRARAGVVTGEVAVTVGVTGQGVAGDTVNTASRVQTVARPGEVWVDEVTERLTHAAIGFVDAGEHLLKGKSEPLRLWTATRVLSNIGGVQRVDGLEAPLLGRDAELRAIKELFHATAERRAPRMVVVSGPAGVGKSRLGWEFEKYIDGLVDPVSWHRGRCLSYGDGVAFWALAEIVRQRLGIADEDPAHAAAAKLVDGLDAHLRDPAERSYVGARLARLLGVPFDADNSATLPRDELFAGWRLFFERLAAVNPVVLLVEDAYHADVGLLDFLDHLVDWARDAPIYLLVFTRPELADARPGWGIGRNRTTLTLDPLDAVSMDGLVDALVPGMPPTTRAAVTRQAQGIPLFAVETIRALIDRDVVVPRDGVYQLAGDVSSLTVPDSLRGLLAARLDALAPDLRTLLADAAVLGASFPADALVAVSGRAGDEVDRALAELVRREIMDVSADPLSPQRGSYQFSQNLLRQVVYETLSRRDRKSRHLAVAGYLRAAFPGDGDEVIDVIARHYTDALEAMPADADAAETRAQAVGALIRAAERAVRSGALRSAAASFATAAVLTVDSGSADERTNAAQLWEKAARVDILDGRQDDAVSHARRAAEIYDDLGSTRAAARARTVAGDALRNDFRYDDARAELLTALEVLRRDPDQDTVAALSELSMTALFSGAPDAYALTREALELGQAVGAGPALLSRLFEARGISLQFANRSEEALACLGYGIRLAEKEGDAPHLARAFINFSDALLTSDPAAAVEAARSAVELSRRIGARISLSLAVSNLASALIWIGEWDAAEQVFADSAQDGFDDLIAAAQAQALVAALRGDLATVQRLGALPGYRSDTDNQTIAYVGMVDAVAAHVDGRVAEALAVARAILAERMVMGLRHETIVWAWTLAARAAHELGDRAAQTELLSVLDDEPIGHLPPLLRAERLLAHARADAAADDPGALAAFDEAVVAFRAASSPYHLGHGLLDQAERVVDPAARAALVDEAVEIAERLDAALLRARIGAVTPAARQLGVAG